MLFRSTPDQDARLATSSPEPSGLTKSYFTTLPSAPPDSTPLTSRCAPLVVLVVATRVPADPSKGLKSAISRNWAP